MHIKLLKTNFKLLQSNFCNSLIKHVLTGINKIQMFIYFWQFFLYFFSCLFTFSAVYLLLVSCLCIYVFISKQIWTPPIGVKCNYKRIWFEWTLKKKVKCSTAAWRMHAVNNVWHYEYLARNGFLVTISVWRTIFG